MSSERGPEPFPMENGRRICPEKVLRVPPAAAAGAAEDGANSGVC